AKRTPDGNDNFSGGACPPCSLEVALMGEDDELPDYPCHKDYGEHAEERTCYQCRDKCRDCPKFPNKKLRQAAWDLSYALRSCLHDDSPENVQALTAAKAVYREVHGQTVELEALRSAAKRAENAARKRKQEWRGAAAALAEIMPLANEKLSYIWQPNPPEDHPADVRELEGEFLMKRVAELETREEFYMAREEADRRSCDWELAVLKFKASYSPPPDDGYDSDVDSEWLLLV
ncbi:hypothetical protein FIE12Z_13031, partial [Fusarium flagelliforme]